MAAGAVAVGLALALWLASQAAAQTGSYSVAASNAGVATAAAAASTRLAMATIVEGEAAVRRGEAHADLVEGAVLEPGDIVSTGHDGLVRIEWHDGLVVDVGASTRIELLRAEDGNAEARHAIFVREGLIKVTARRPAERREGDDAMISGVRAALIDIPRPRGVFILSVDAGWVEVFVEAGELRVDSREAGAEPVGIDLVEGEFYLRTPQAPGGRSKRPTAMFVATLPPEFRDTLPRLRGRFESRDITLEWRTPPEAARGPDGHGSEKR